jgi:calcium-dependent protein kinase
MGVLLFIMLSGRPPFAGKDNKEIIKNVLKGQFSFDHPNFKAVSDEAKDLITKLL